jgi:thioesterase domain-containing protein
MTNPAVVELNLTVPFPGAHSAMLREPEVGELADRLREHLRTARAVWTTADFSPRESNRSD